MIPHYRIMEKLLLFTILCLTGFIITAKVRAQTSTEFTRMELGPVANDGGNSQGISWGDYDNDGYTDLYITNMGYPVGQNNFLYHNEGDGTFTRITDQIVANDHGKSRGASWGDFNNDGDLDLCVANCFVERNQFYANNGNGTFEKVTSSPVVQAAYGSNSPNWLDYDNDGDLDLFIANAYGPTTSYNPFHNQLFRNDSFTFVEISGVSLVTDVSQHYGAVYADYDGDGDQDIFVANAGGADNDLYQNNSDGTFSRLDFSPVCTDGGESFGASWGDFDNDGDPDLYATNVQASSAGLNFLYRNDGAGVFTKITSGPAVEDQAYSFGSCFGDYDNDGDLDLFVANYGSGVEALNFLYNNDGAGNFTRITTGNIATDQNASYGAAWCDYDRDGDLDLAVANFADENENNAFYINNGSLNNWLVIKCIGTESNRSAYGARVRVKAVIGSGGLWQTREIASMTGFCAQSCADVHFGLGNAAIVDSVQIEWPESTIQILTDIDVNQYLTVEETPPFLCGNANNDLSVNIGDAVFLVNFIFHNGPPPYPLAAADVNCDLNVNIGDAVYLLNFIFNSASSPDPCAACE